MKDSSNFIKLNIKIGYSYLVHTSFSGEFFLEGEVKPYTVRKGSILTVCIFQGKTEFKEYQTGEVVLVDRGNALIPITKDVVDNLELVK